MAWVWTAIGSVGLGITALCFVAAVLVYAGAPRRLPNRLLALVLLGEGALALGGTGLMYLTDDPASTFAWQIAAFFVFGAVPCLYLAFLSTVPARLARPLARLRPLLYAASPVIPLWVLADPHAFVPRIVPGTFSPWNMEPGWAFSWALLFPSAIVAIVGLAVAVSAVRAAAPSSIARSQAIAYLSAFAAFDLKNLMYIVVPILGRFPDSVLIPGWLLYLHNALTAGFVLLLAYGVLKAQLFDIDLKIKWTLRRGTVVSIFIGAFFVATAIAEQYLERYGVLIGGAAAGLLLLAFRPIERAADRLADRAMPSVRDTGEYRTVQKRAVYRAAVEGALEDGGVSDKERAMLARLADQLGLGPLEMHDIEREARAARGVA